MNVKGIDKSYDLGISLIIINCWLGETSTFTEIYGVLKIFIQVAIIFAFGIEMRKYNYTYLKGLFHFLLLGFGFYNYLHTNSAWGLYSILIILFSEKKNINHILNVILKLMFFLFCINACVFVFEYLIAPSLLNIIESTDSKRYCLNFLSPNEAARYWIYIVFLWYYVKKEHTFVQWTFVLCITILIYKLTDSDTCIFIIIPLLAEGVRRYKFFQEIGYLSSKFAFLLLAISTYYLIVNPSDLSSMLDEMFFTGRLSLARKALLLYGYTFWGQQVEFYIEIGQGDDWSFLVVDNAYAYMLISSGFIYVILISALMLFFRNRADYKGSICLLLYAAIALAENNILSPTAIFPLVIAYNGLFVSSIKRNTDDKLKSKYLSISSTNFKTI